MREPARPHRQQLRVRQLLPSLSRLIGVIETALAARDDNREFFAKGQASSEHPDMSIHPHKVADFEEDAGEALYIRTHKGMFHEHTDKHILKKPSSAYDRTRPRQCPGASSEQDHPHAAQLPSRRSLLAPSFCRSQGRCWLPSHFFCPYPSLLL